MAFCSPHPRLDFMWKLQRTCSRPERHHDFIQHLLNEVNKGNGSSVNQLRSLSRVNKALTLLEWLCLVTLEPAMGDVPRGHVAATSQELPKEATGSEGYTTRKRQMQSERATRMLNAQGNLCSFLSRAILLVVNCDEEGTPRLLALTIRSVAGFESPETRCLTNLCKLGGN